MNFNKISYGRCENCSWVWRGRAESKLHVPHDRVPGCPRSDSLQTLVFSSGSARSRSGTNQGRWKPLRAQSLGSRLPHPLCPCRSAAGGEGQWASFSGCSVVPSGLQTGTPTTPALLSCHQHRDGLFFQNMPPGLWGCPPDPGGGIE